MKIKILVFVIIIACISIGAITVFSVPVKVVDQLVNYPNPFDSRKEYTNIYYKLEAPADVRIEIYDLLGYKVSEKYYARGVQGAEQGTNRIIWDGKNDDGRKVAKGGYICRVYAEYDDAYAYAVHKIGVIH